MSGTNLQNLKKGVQRQMLIPDPGEEFCICDLWQAEAYLTALDAQEITLLELLNSGMKIHQWLLDETTETFSKEVEAANYRYHEAKESIHALNYGISSGEMTVRWYLPSHVTEWQHFFYHKTFPGIRLRQIRIKDTLYKTRTLVSLLGRKKIFIAPMTEKVLHQAYAWCSQSCIGELTIVALTKLFHLGVLSKNFEFVAHFEELPPSYLCKIPWMFPALNTHDGLAIRCLKGNRKAVEKCVKDAFDVPLSKSNLTITIPIEVGWSDNFNDVKDMKVLRYNSSSEGLA